MFLKYVSILHHQAIDQQNLIFCQRKKNTHIFCIYLFSPYRSIHPVVLLRKGVLKIYSKCTGEHPCQSVISIKLQSNYIEITLRHWCFPVSLLYILRAPFPKNTSVGLLLNEEDFRKLYDSLWKKEKRFKKMGVYYLHLLMKLLSKDFKLSAKEAYLKGDNSY